MLTLGFGMINKSAVPVQNYITAIVVFLIVEQLMTWGYYSKFISKSVPLLLTYL